MQQNSLSEDIASDRSSSYAPPADRFFKSKLLRYLELLLTFCSDHLWLIVATVLGWLILFHVPQINNLWWQHPTSAVELAAFVFFIVTLIAIYPLTLLWIWQRSMFRDSRPTLRDRILAWLDSTVWLKRLGTLLFLVPRNLSRPLLDLACLCSAFAHGALGWTLIAMLTAGGAVAAIITPLTIPYCYTMCGGFIRMLGLWMVLAGLWLLGGKLLGVSNVLVVRNRPTDSAALCHWRNVWWAVGHILSWLAFATLLGEFLWITASLHFSLASFRLYSIWAAFHIPFACASVAALVDYAQWNTKFPVRLLTCAVLVAMLVVPYSTGKTVRDEEAPTSTANASYAASDAPNSDREIDAGSDPYQTQLESRLANYLAHLDARISSMPDGPAVIISASGGGSRAALFTALVLQFLAGEPMQLQQSDSSHLQAANSIEQIKGDSTTRLDQSRWIDHVWLLSSVSGGSLATARFLADLDLATQRVETLRYTSEAELRSRTRDKVAAWIDSPAKSPCSENQSLRSLQKSNTNVQSLGDDDPEKQRLKRLHLALEVDASSSAQSENNYDRQVQSTFRSRLADDMCADFMAPILRGVLTPFASRGDCLYQFWDQQYLWGGKFQNTLANSNLTFESSANPRLSKSKLESHVAGPHNACPLALINTADIETGRRVILGFPAVPAGFLLGSEQFPGELRLLASNASQSIDASPVSLADFSCHPRTEVTLTRAVRLSSNFPWGFGTQHFSPQSTPPVVLHDLSPTVRGLSCRTKLELIDGGVVDNTGLDSVVAVFEALFTRSLANPFGIESGIIRKLRERGIVLIEIDSGAKPASSASDDTTIGDLLRPLTALGNAAYTSSMRDRDGLIQHLLLRLSVSKLAAKLASLPYSAESLQNSYINVERQQLQAALDVAVPGESDVHRALATLQHFRFSCNHISETRADVMTAFALGPDDKAVIYAMFLTELQRWTDWWEKSAQVQYGSVRRYFASSDSPDADLTAAEVRELSSQLASRTEAEIGALKALSEPDQLDSSFEQQMRLRRVITLLLGLRNLELYLGETAQPELRQALLSLSELLDEQNLVEFKDSQVVTSEPDKHEVSIFGAMNSLQLNPDAIQRAYDAAKTAKQATQSSLDIDFSFSKDATPMEERIPEIGTDGQTEWGTAESLPEETFSLRDAMRQQAQDSQMLEQQRRFYKQKQ